MKKKCTQCGEEKSIENYYWRNKRKRQRFAECKACSRKRHKNWVKNNEHVKRKRKEWYHKTKEKRKDTIEAGRKRFYENNPTYHKEYSKKYRSKNLEILKEKDRQKYYNNREQILEKAQIKRENKPGYIRQWWRVDPNINRKSDPLKYGWRSDKNIDLLIKRDGRKCGICNEKIVCDIYNGRLIHIDHIVPRTFARNLGWGKNKINHIANLQLVHAQCNHKKPKKGCQKKVVEEIENKINLLSQNHEHKHAPAISENSKLP